MDQLPIPHEDQSDSLDVLENEEFVRWVQDDSIIMSEALSNLIDGIIRGKRKKIQVFLLALFKNRIDKLAFLFSAEEKLKEVLFSDARIKDMTNNQLISLFKTLHSQSKDILEFLDYISQQDVDLSQVKKPPHDEMASKFAKLSPESRNKLRTVLAMLVSDEEGAEPPPTS